MIIDQEGLLGKDKQRPQSRVVLSLLKAALDR